MTTVHQEIEAKYDADDDVVLPSLVELFGAVRGHEGMPASDGTPLAEGDDVRQHLSATYYDTPDLDLAAVGLTLRRRTGGDDAGWHLKVPVADGERSEVRVPLDQGEHEGQHAVPDRLVAMTYARTGGQGLVPVARIDTERTVRRLVDPTGRVLAELADDRVTARRLHPGTEPGEAAGAATTWREVELELVDGSREVLSALDPLLRERGLTPAASGSKLLRTLEVEPGAGGATSGSTTGPTTGTGGATGGTTASGKVGAEAGTKAGAKAERRRARALASASAADVVLSHVAAQVAQIRAQDLPVRLDVPGAVHAMRVASRRLRSALSTFEPLFHGAVTRPVARELRWLAGVLGAARDAEVMRDRLNASVGEESHDARLRATVAEEVRGQLEQAYRQAHDDVLVQLDSDRYRALLAALVALAEHPPFKDRATRPAREVLTGLVARSYADLRSAMKAARTADDPQERHERLHDARKAAKRTRYAAESVTPVLGPDAKAFATAMERVQEALGEHLESHNTRARLRELAAETTLPSTAFTYGRLHAQEDVRAERSAAEVEDAWAVASRKRLRRWLG